MRFQEHVRVWLSFSKKERYGIYLILMVYLLLWLLPLGFSGNEVPADVLDVRPLDVQLAMDTLAQREKEAGEQYARQRQQRPWSRAASPNASSSRAAQELNPYRSARPSADKHIDVNTSDSAAFERLPAIGEKLSSRIVRYRDRLGGFIRLTQLEEVYGITDTTLPIVLPYLRISDSFVPKKIYINRADLNELGRHPYVGYATAKTLLAYRNQHGRFSSLESLKMALLEKGGQIERFIPYCSFED